MSNNLNNEIMTEQEKVASPKVSAKRMTSTQRKTFFSIFIVLFVLVLVGVNVLSAFLVDKFPSLEVDFTSDGAYSLQDSTKEYLDYLENNINIMVLMSEDSFESYDTYAYQANQLLKEMSAYKNITLEYIDVEMEAVSTLTEEYPDIDWSDLEDVIIVEDTDSGKYKGINFEDVFTYSLDYSTYEYYLSAQNVEKAVLSGIQRIISDKIVKVALSVGNGEVLSEENSVYGYYYYEFASILEDNAYDVVNVNLLTEEIPEDAEFLIMLAPSYDLSDAEAEAVSIWLENDGNYGRSFMLVPYYNGTDTPTLDLFLEQWGMKVEKGYIEETESSLMVGSAYENLVNYANDTYTATLKDTSISVVMPYCQPVIITDTELASPLLSSSDGAGVLMLTSSTSDEISYLDATDGGYSAAAIATKTNSAGESSNVIVWGSSSALQNNVLKSTNYNNLNYFINLLNTLCENELGGFVVEGVKLEGSTMTVTAAHENVFRAVFVIIIPLALVVFGIVVWVRRRNR